MTSEQAPTVAVVVPVHNNRATITELHQRIEATLDSTGETGEIVLVDDGSTDDSWAALASLAEKSNCTRALRLARCFGQVPAIVAGVEATSAALVIYLDADLEYAPEDISVMVRHLRDGADMVSAIRPDRSQRPPLRRLLSSLSTQFGPAEVRAQLTDPGSGFKGWQRRVWTEALLQPGQCRDPLVLVAHIRAADRVDNVEVKWAPSNNPSSFRAGDLLGLFISMGATISPALFAAAAMFGLVVSLLATVAVITLFATGGSWEATELLTIALALLGALLATSAVLGLAVRRSNLAVGPVYRIAAVAPYDRSNAQAAI